MPKKQFFVSEVKLGRFNGHKLVEKSLGKGLTLRHEFCHELANHFFYHLVVANALSLRDRSGHDAPA